jgi:hypothetical protein
MTLAGSSILDYTGVLDLVPAVVDRTRQTASAFKSGVGSGVGHIANNAQDAAKSALDYTGATRYFGSYISYAKSTLSWASASLIEEGRHITVKCYSPSCAPGVICYSPTCVRYS